MAYQYCDEKTLLNPMHFFVSAAAPLLKPSIGCWTWTGDLSWLIPPIQKNLRNITLTFEYIDFFGRINGKKNNYNMP